MTTGAPVLSLRNLSVRFGDDPARAPAVREVSLTLASGEVLGLIGESGSGKTVTGLALMGLLPPGARVSADVMTFAGTDLTGGERAFAPLRGRHLGMVFQDPAGSFNPAKTVAWHLRHALRRGGADPREAAARLAEVGLRAPERVLAAFPHQLSGGMLQRVLIAAVMAVGPDLVIADEPTTNLDAVVERQILALLRRRQRVSGCAMLFITHDLTLARDLCDRIAVMYAGTIVETGPVAQVLEAPGHPYTRALLATARSLARGDPWLFELPGEPGGPPAPSEGCAFAGRCPDAAPACRRAPPPLVAVDAVHYLRCVRSDA